MQRLLKYWHTLRHLKPVQIYGRLWFRWHTPKVDISPAQARRPGLGPWVEPAPKRQSQFGPVTFRFLNSEHTLEGEDSWNDTRCAKLWLYNLHYFDDLCAVGWRDRAKWHKFLIEKWIDDNPPGEGNGWEPYPTSLRIVNWIKWAQAGSPLSPAMVQSLAVQSRWLSKRIEHHLLANHLFVNAKALLFAGLFFRGDEAVAWRSEALRILDREIPKQVLADGGHFELSPMYHALILEDILDVINADLRWPGKLDPGQSDLLRRAAMRMLHWLGSMVHPDGDISFFNDAAFGIAPLKSELRDYVKRLKLDAPERSTAAGVHHLRESGYVRALRGNALLIADAARIGPDEQPGHAHADTLSFEFSLGSQRVFVNSGTSTYATGPQRSLERGTAAHNTLVINGCDSSEVWGGFRVARRARPFDILCCDDAEGSTVAASHDGYKRLAGRPIHRREWRLTDSTLTVTDRITGSCRSAAAYFHLHPEAKVVEKGVIALPGGQRIRYSARGGAVAVKPGAWHPEFGRNVANACLVLTLAGPESVLELQWK
ncbi:MAG: heparinase II/III family protein [Planctomycetes bacterium]|nr:heparinase II/III family protein [Planctomycetota bacterium]